MDKRSIIIIQTSMLLNIRLISKPDTENYKKYYALETDCFPMNHEREKRKLLPKNKLQFCIKKLKNRV